MISKELGQKCNNQDMNWHTHDMLVLQTAALSTTPQYWLSNLKFIAINSHVTQLITFFLVPCIFLASSSSFSETSWQLFPSYTLLLDSIHTWTAAVASGLLSSLCDGNHLLTLVPVLLQRILLSSQRPVFIYTGCGNDIFCMCLCNQQPA